MNRHRISHFIHQFHLLDYLPIVCSLALVVGIGQEIIMMMKHIPKNIVIVQQNNTVGEAEEAHATLLAELFGTTDSSLSNLLPSMSLIGIFANSNPNYSQIILSINGHESIYRTGEQTTEGVSIQSITPAEVMVEYRGKMYPLVLPKFR